MWVCPGEGVVPEGSLHASGGPGPLALHLVPCLTLNPRSCSSNHPRLKGPPVWLSNCWLNE